MTEPYVKVDARPKTARWLLPLLLLAPGCDIRSYRVTTRISAEGAVHREIWQPLDETLPPEAFAEHDAPTTQSSQPASRPSITLASKWKARWNSVGSADAPSGTSGGPYLRASGDFETVEDIPPTYYRSATPLPERASEDVIAHAEDNYHLFAIEYWQEEITETVNLAEYVSAVDAFSRLMIPLLEKAVNSVYGREYDLRRFHTYVRQQVAPAFRAYCLWFFQRHPATVDDLSEEGVRELQRIFRLMDVELPLTDDLLVDLETLDAAVTKSGVEILQHTVRHRNGDKLSDDDALDLWERIQEDLGIDLSGEDEDEADSSTRRTAWRPGRARARRAENLPGGSVPRLLAALQTTLLSPDGREAQKQLLSLEAQMGGAHHNSPINRFAALFGSGSPAGISSFSYTLETPGPVIETNAIQLADTRLRWDFTSEDLFPNGISMSAQWVKWHRDVERQLFGRIVLHETASVVHLMELIGEEGPLFDALADAVKQKTLKPVEELLQDEDASIRDAAREILDLRVRPRRERNPADR